MGESFAIKNTGEIETDDRKLYTLKNIIFNGEQLSFNTSATRGVRYAFAGRFVRPNTKKNMARGFRKKVLHGRFTKFVNGKKTAAADVCFDSSLLGDFG